MKLKNKKYSEMKNLLFTILFTALTIGLYSQPDILPPVLTKPTDAATNQMPDAELDWYAVNGIGTISYEIQIDTSNLFPDPVTMTSVTTAVNAQDLIFGDQYFWRVRASDNTGTSDWSAVFSFTIFNLVALNKPTDTANNQMPNVGLSWSNRKGAIYITGITYYDIQGSFLEDFSTIDFSNSLATGTFPADSNFVLYRTSNLLFDTTYYWRVRARHNFGTCEWSAPWSFSVATGVTLLTPANNATNQDPNITLTWAPLTGINDYIYQVCSDPNFTFPCITGLANDDYTSITVPELLFGNTYYWRLQAAHDADTSDWSAVRSFQVINSVLLHLPANGSAGLSTLPTLDWLPIIGIDGYELRVYDEDYTYSDTAFLETNLYNVFKPLELGKDYFWKVRTFSNGDTTNWSETWQFHTGPQGTGNIALNDNNINLYPNPSKGLLTFELKSARETEIQVTVVDFVGKVVFEKYFLFRQGSDAVNIDLNNLNDGLYFIRFKTGQNVYTRKLIINK